MNKYSLASELQLELSIMIRAKILLNDPLPYLDHGHLISVSVQNGTLKVTYTHLFELVLTLRHLDVEADWNILSFTILSAMHRLDGNSSTYEFGAIETEVQRTLREKIEKYSIDASETGIAESIPLNGKKYFKLSQIMAICRHVAIGASQRLLYVQSQAYISNCAKHFVQSVLTDEAEGCLIKVAFWPKQTVK